MNETINVVATVQKEVRSNQQEMKNEMQEIKIIVDNNGSKLDDHLLAQASCRRVRADYITGRNRPMHGMPQ